MSANAKRTSTKFRAGPPRLMELAKDCAIVGSSFQGRKYGRIRTGNAHAHTITKITNHVQRTLLTYPAQITTRPLAMTAREVKPAGAKPSWNLHGGPPPQRLLSRRVAAALHIAGASIRNANVRRTHETNTTSRQLFNSHPLWSSPTRCWRGVPGFGTLQRSVESPGKAAE